VEVHAAGINFADILMAQGKYQVRPQTPFVPGECSLFYLERKTPLTLAGQRKFGKW
jgi:hypothetical protein